MVFDKHIPIPVRPGDIVAKMTIGDSIWMKSKSSVPYWKMRTGFQLVCNKETNEDGVVGYRIWRTA